MHLNKYNSIFKSSLASSLLIFSNSLFAADSQSGDADPVSDEAIDTISVTASRIARGTKEVPAAINVIDSKRIDAEQMQNIKDAIRGTPGVLIESKNGGYDSRLIIRGAGQKANYGVREIMVIRDGVPMTDPDSFSRFDFIDTQDIERIEITKGPGSCTAAVHRAVRSRLFPNPYSTWMATGSSSELVKMDRRICISVTVRS